MPVRMDKGYSEAGFKKLNHKFNLASKEEDDEIFDKLLYSLKKNKNLL
jgi:hypothetical protein